MSDDGGTEHNNTFVWGTNLVIADIQNRIRRFMRSFTQQGSSEALYTTLIKQVSHVTNPSGTSVSQDALRFGCNSAINLRSAMHGFYWAVLMCRQWMMKRFFSTLT